MLEKQGITFLASCDFCGDDVETDEDEFVPAVEAIKRAGWKVFRQSGQWFHKCDNCQASDSVDDFENVE